MRSHSLLSGAVVGFLCLLLAASCGPVHDASERDMGQAAQEILEAQALYAAVYNYTKDFNGGNLPEFDSRRPPVWLQGNEATKLGLTSSDWDHVRAALKRPWSTRIPEALVGRPFASLSNKTILFEVVGSKGNSHIQGIRVDLEIVTTQR